MAQTQLVIKGAIYFDNEADQIVIPALTGQYWMVDCERYRKIKDMIGSYDKKYFQSVKDNFVIFEGVKYFYCQVSPEQIDNWDLLSDLSELSFNDELREF